MKKQIPLLVIMLITLNCIAQEKLLIDSLTNELKIHKRDTTATIILNNLCRAYLTNNPDKAMDYANQCLALSELIGFKKGTGRALNHIGMINFNKGNYLPALEFHNKALQIGKEVGDKRDIAGSYNNIGNVYKHQGNLPEALKNYLAALKMNEESGDKQWQAITLSNIGGIYFQQSNYTEALKNSLAALKLREEIGDKNGICNSYVNIGNIYNEQGNYSEALKNCFACLKIVKEIGDKFGIAITYNNIGEIYKKQGDQSEALKNFFASIKIAEEIGDKEGIAITYINIGDSYTKQKKYNQAFEYLNKALSLSKEIGSLENINAVYDNLTTLDSAQGNFKQAFEHHKLFVTYRDSIVNTNNTKKTVALQMNYDFDKKIEAAKVAQEKKDIKQRNIRNSIAGGLALALTFLFVVYRQRNKISIARKRSDELLLNILPEEVAEELKQKGSAEAKQFDNATVMFTDFKDFTQISEKLSPTELVSEIHTCFKAFDEIIGKHNIEKIKTIGDAYMCAAGLPVANTTNAADVVKAAIEIQQFMLQHLEDKKRQGQELFEIRIGIHTGPVVAGIVGIKKFAYDIWGDTVNIASRMESSGEAGKINISGSTYEIVKDKFTCIHRGKIQAKNKGEIEMYFIEEKI